MPQRRRARAAIAAVVVALLVALFSTDYTVKRGDTLGRIARQHGVTVSELVNANDIANPDLIFPGQVLAIPGEEGEPAVVHVVARGETLTGIAAKYGTSLFSLVEANGISNPNLILIGQQLLISGEIPTQAGDGGSKTPVPDPNVRTGRFHIVQPGETLDRIAAQYSGVTPDQIARANGILNGTVYRGTRLFLDGPEFVAKGTAGETVHVVKRGERLAEIAAAYKTSINTLAGLNKITDPNLIIVGQQLVVPTGARWLCPVDGASFFNDWGFPRGSGTRWHEGNDLFTAHGSPVYAPVAGTVQFKTGSIGGNQFNLHGDDGVEYVGSHLSAFGKDGRVGPGEIIGFVGTTGSAQGTPPHLHFAMYLEGDVAINPYPTLIANGCKG